MTTSPRSTPHHLPPDSYPRHLRCEHGLLTIAAADGDLLRDCWAAVELSTGQRYTTEEGVCEPGVTAEQLVIRSAGDHLRPELRWHVALEPDRRAVWLWVEVVNTTAQPLAVERIDVCVAPTGFRQTPAAELAVLQTGWQSWSYATPPVPLAPLARTAPPPMFGPRLPPTEAERTLLPWMTLIHTADQQAARQHRFLIGFTSANDQAGIIAIQPALIGHRCTASTYVEGAALAPQAILRSETLLLLFDEEDSAALARYAAALAATMEARRWPHVPTGWCSWYYFFTAVSEADLLRNLAQIAAARHELSIEYVQLDDGYQQQIGDWLSINEKFPRGMRFLADEIRAEGYKPGIWLAPFLLAETSEVYAQHPDWVVRDEHGTPLNAIYNWDTNNYVLDTTHPAAMQWLRQVIATMVHEWGYDYLKIDFIYAAALRGVRYGRNVTGIQAYRRGLALIREIAGDRFILGCGAPFAPSVGLVDGMRIGPDAQPYWSKVRDRYGAARGLHNAIRSTFAHGWMHPQLWVNDPDCLLVREHNSQLTLAEVQSWASTIALSGGMALVSDDLSRLEPERAAIIARVLPPLGTAAVPLPPYVDHLPTRAQLVIERPWERWLIVGLFNWHDHDHELRFDPAAWDAPIEQPYHLFDLWTGEHQGPCTGAISLPTAAHGVRLLAVHADLGRPQLVGSTLHLLGGAVELAGETWAADTLHLTLRCPGRRQGVLAVYVPPGYSYQPITHAGGVQHGRVLQLPIEMIDQTEITLHFKRIEANE